MNFYIYKILTKTINVNDRKVFIFAFLYELDFPET